MSPLTHTSIIAGLMSVMMMWLIVLSLVSPLYAASDPIYTMPNSNDALEGYDPVAYFSKGKPVKGSDKYTLNYRGANWRFSSQKNLDAFTIDPQLYAPQYGGYCAFAMATGGNIKGNPKHWIIVDDKLYFNINEDVHKIWLAKKRDYIADADKNWPAALN